ncbi:MAG: hypothetical protein AABY07_00270 [Nanoarchaeota archaeon]
MKQTGWAVLFKNGDAIEQYPDSGEDNTLLWRDIKNNDDVKQFIILDQNHRIGIDLEARIFIFGDNFIPFVADEKIKLVYFINRYVHYNINPHKEIEEPKIFVVGYEDSKGKIFLNLEEGSGQFFFTNDNIN